MRFPAVLYSTIIQYLAKQHLAGNKRFPLVLMLEPTLRCNLDCIGCGRIAEYHEKRCPDLTLEECLESVDECGAPIVSVCGGEPLIYQPVDQLIQELYQRKKYVYLCTNAMFLDRFWDRIPPHKRLCLSIHLDGMEEGHDWAVNKPGVFKKVNAVLQEAKKRGYRVATNTTLFSGSNPQEIINMMEYLQEIGVDGMLISGAYPQEGVKGEASFKEREQMESIFQEIFGKNGAVKKYRLDNSPLYIEFLQGLREIACSPWGSPNRTVQGWKAPCYVLNDGYYKTFQELMEKTDWDSLGPGKDPRCTACKIHSGFETTISFGQNCSLKDYVRMIGWNLFS
ncbi:MAG: adenosyl-hopene transferase HpnH [Candidatus Omnitrophica bacterium]|nr:adenosyl-hopene transferase HpnH [Candidatus Omnitrophota bacterium]